jgi:hypothetical protein
MYYYSSIYTNFNLLESYIYSHSFLEKHSNKVVICTFNVAKNIGLF